MTKEIKKKEKKKTDYKEIEEESSDKEPTQTEVLLEIASQFPLFHDEFDIGYTFIKNEVIPLQSDKYKQYLAHQYYKKEGEAVSKESINKAITVLSGKAKFENDKKILHTRIAKQGSAFLFDMGNSNSIKITPDGWEIIPSPIIFKRYSHQQEQVEPTHGGNPYIVFQFLNIDKKHELLVLVYIISCYIPDIPHPIFHPHGSQGAGKTTMFRIIKRLCDPSELETIITPNDSAQLIQVLSHHHVCLFDNLNNIKSGMSDILAQACTGGGFSKRQLYTDDDDIIYKFKRCIGLNGINLLIYKPDLMDRSILLTLERINKSKRMEEKRLWENFEKVKAEILGGFFDVLSKAMGIYEEVTIENNERMADFTRWGFAIAEALGGRGEEFLNAYKENIEQQNEEVIQGSTLAQAVLTFMDGKTVWEGSVGDALTELHKIANPEDDRAFLRNDTTFPKVAKNLRKYLETIETNLKDKGITFKIGNKEKSGVPIIFHNHENGESLGSLASQHHKNNVLEGDERVTQTNEIDFESPANQLKNNDCDAGDANDAKFKDDKEDELIDVLGI
jgi:hypothetical protein